MKTILVPIDYSKTATNAVEYAIEIAKITHAKIILLHIFDIPVAVTDMPVVIPTFDDYENSQKVALKNFEHKIIAKHGEEVSISSILKSGFIFDEIKETVENKKVDLIIMGITGAGKISELIIGSNASRVIKNIDCPVITVHENVKFKEIKKIAFASDFDGIEESKAIDKLIEFIQLFNAKLLLINIKNPTTKTTYKKVLSASLLNHIFDNIDHTLSIRKNDDITDGLNSFVDHHKIDLLVMLPKKHTLFTRLFHESNTKKMAFHTHVPLLTIHN